MTQRASKVMELVAGMVSALGAAVLLSGGSSLLAYVGCLASACTFLALFLGQRLAKDYAGAATLVPYFCASLLGLWACRVR